MNGQEVTLPAAMRPSVAGDNPQAPIPGELERAFQEHSNLVFRTAYRITGNAADAEDALQTVFLRLSRRDLSSAALENHESYLRRAAVNVALDIMRARQSARSVPIEDAPERSLTEPSGEISREMKECIRRAVAQLPRRDAEVFTLRFFEGHSNPEIARLLGISQVHVAVILHRSRRQLQKEVRSYMGGRS
jgi:RNA polymerase sigma-70 factor (ECF subfamily)